MAKKIRKYDKEYKVQAVKLSRELGSIKRAAEELGMPEATLFGWIRAVKEGRLDIGGGAHTPDNALTLTEELIQSRKQIKLLEKEIKQLKRENEFLEEASVFFAASRQKSQKMKG